MKAAAWGGLARWVWHGRGVAPWVVRAALLPVAGLYRLVTVVRNAAYDAGALAARPLPAPSVGVGNLAVGGAGKTPVAAWVAAELARRGVRPGIVLRGYGGDEVALHAASAPGAIVAADPDRQAAARRAVSAGAEVLVLDDCLQRRDVAVDVMLVAVAAETWRGDRWPLPAGPWREGVAGLRRADAVVVTRKAAAPEAALAIAMELAPRTRGIGVVADVLPRTLRPIAGGDWEPLGALRDREVLAVCGIGEPGLFAAQLRQAGAVVELMAWGDHHAYDARDVARIRARAGSRAVVTTAKDAVKLAASWPVDGPPCLVAALTVEMAVGAAMLGDLLDRVAQRARTLTQPEAAAVPLHHS